MWELAELLFENAGARAGLRRLDEGNDRRHDDRSELRGGWLEPEILRLHLAQRHAHVAALDRTVADALGANRVRARLEEGNGVATTVVGLRAAARTGGSIRRDDRSAADRGVVRADDATTQRGGGGGLPCGERP